MPVARNLRAATLSPRAVLDDPKAFKSKHRQYVVRPCVSVKVEGR